MALDSFWEMPREDDPSPTFDPPLRLCGGMFSGNGADSFRGKVYGEMIERLSGVSLYQEEMTNSDVKVIADALDAASDTVINEEFRFVSSAEELNDLRRMFRAYADAGATLHGWW